MVRVAIAGGSGQVAREVIDALLVKQRHEITVLSRAESSAKSDIAGVQWKMVNYDDRRSLVDALQEIHTVLSFLQLLNDPEGRAQRNLIDAAIEAGVKRFAPSEYASAEKVNMPWNIGKERTRQYLKKVNSGKRILEYTLFQPGLFLDYLAFPYKTARHVDPLMTVFDFENCRAIVVDGHDNAVITLTTAADVASIVAQAVDYDGLWPEIGGIAGNKVTFRQVIQIGEKIRGRPFAVDKVKSADLEAGVLNTSWALAKRHHAVSEEQYAGFVKTVSIGILLSSIKGAWNVSSDFNHIFPEYRFDEIEGFLARVWNGRP